MLLPFACYTCRVILDPAVSRSQIASGRSTYSGLDEFLNTFRKSAYLEWLRDDLHA